MKNILKSSGYIITNMILDQQNDTTNASKRKLDLGRIALAGLLAYVTLIAVLSFAFSLRTLLTPAEHEAPAIPIALQSGSVDLPDVPFVEQKHQVAKRAAKPGTQHERNVAAYIAKGYWLKRDFADEVVRNAVRVGKEFDVDPLLILSVIAIESSFNPRAQSSVGAQGLMQVHTRVHKEKFSARGKGREQFSIHENLRVGTGILKRYIQKSGSISGGLKRYVGAANHASDGGYSKRVMREYGRLAYAARGYVTRSVHLLWKKREGPPRPRVLSGNRQGEFRAYEAYFVPPKSTTPRRVLVSSAR